ncbi:MAG: hypothetical protein ACKOFU_05975, partial [Actinomycetota bacterium]
SWGSFANEEWHYVLLSKSTDSSHLNHSATSDAHLCIENEPAEQSRDYSRFVTLFETMDRHLNVLERLNCNIGIYGAAGKGTVFGFNLMRLGMHFNAFALDANAHRIGLYMEGSGIQVWDRARLFASRLTETLIIVMNPAHFDFASENYGEKFRIIRLEDLSTL